MFDTVLSLSTTDINILGHQSVFDLVQPVANGKGIRIVFSKKIKASAIGNLEFPQVFSFLKSWGYGLASEYYSKKKQ